jgi:hypothetical protein
MIAVAAVAASMLLPAQDAKNPSITQLMTQEELRETGVASLSTAQRAALDRWLSRYTQVILKISGTQAQQASPPASGSRSGPPTRRLYARTGGGHWISENNSGGKIILLEDGSLWQINPIDQVDTALWLSITEITVLEVDSPIGEYRYQLINTDDGEQALAQYLGNQ